MLPPALAAELPAAFVGRDAELGRLDDAWRAAASGPRRLAVVTGEPGVGKTALVAAFARRVAETGATLLHGRVVEGLPVPLGPFAEAIRQWAALDPARAEAVLAGAGLELGRLVPDLVAVTAERHDEPADAAVGRYRLFEAVARWIDTVGGDGTTLLVLDDLHWADNGSLLLVRHLLRGTSATRPRPLLVLATARDTEPDPDGVRALLADLWVGDGVDRVRLGGLTEDAVVELAGGASGGRGDFARAVHHRTGGNAFFVRELLRHAGAIDDLPASVVDVLRHRIERLPERTAMLLATAALSGLRFDLEVVADASGVPIGDALDGADDALSARLVHEEPGQAGTLAFSHAIVRDALAAGLGAARRQRLHRRLGEAIERRWGPSGADRQAAALARHFCAAADRDTAARAVAYARIAAAQAMASYAFDEAITHLRRARAVLDEVGAGGDTDGLRLAVLLDVTRAHLGQVDLAGARRHGEEAVVAARAVGDGRALAEAALAVAADGVTVGEVDAPVVALLREALDGVPSDEDGLRVRLHAGLARELLFAGDSHRPVEIAREGLAVARAAGDPVLVSHALGALHQALLGPGDAAERLAIANEALALTQERPDLDARRWAHAYRLIDLLELGDLDGARAAIGACATLAAAMRPARYVWWAEALQATDAIAVGDLERAEALVAAARAHGIESGEPNAVSTWATQLFVLRWVQGRLAELVGFAAAADRGDTRPLPIWQAALAVVEHAAGRVDEARRRLDQLPALPNLAVDTVSRGTIAVAALAAYHVGDATRGADAAALLESHRGRLVVVATGTAVLGATETFIGLGRAAAGDIDGARVELAEGLRSTIAAGAEGLARCPSDALARLARDDPSHI